MNEYRIQRLKEDLTLAQQRNKHQKQQLANYKNVHEKDLKEIERLNNIINELEKWLEYEIYCDFSNEMTKAYQDSLDKLKELKGE